MMRVALLMLLLASAAQADECGALTGFQGDWRAENGWVQVIGQGKIGYQKPDMAKPAWLKIIPAKDSPDLDDVSLSCDTLDAGGIARLVAQWEDYAAVQKGGEDYEPEMADIAQAKALMARPPYRLLKVEQYEGVNYYIRLDRNQMISIETETARLSLVKLKRKV